MTIERVTVSFPPGLSARAHEHGLNVSRVAANAVSRMVELSENETRVNACKQSPRAITPTGGQSNVGI